MRKAVYVHAWEYVNGADAGGGGFDWSLSRTRAFEAFEAGAAKAMGFNKDDFADFFFIVMVPSRAVGTKITHAVDRQLVARCARAKVRRVGANVLAYWRRNSFKMGGAVRPAR